MSGAAAGPGPPFTVDVDRPRRLIRLTLSGLWDLATVERYTAAARAAFQSLVDGGAPPAAIRLLIDLRQHPVQSREVTERIQENIRAAPSHGARHAVLVSESMLHRLQAQRVGTLIDASFFTGEASAMAWLFPATASFHSPEN